MELRAVDLLYDFCMMSVLLMVSKVIRVKIKAVQNLFIPSALIAGFLALLLGEQGLGVLHFSSEVSNYPGILIAILFGSMFLGSDRKVSFRSMISNVGDTFFVNAAAEMAQFGLMIVVGATLLPVIFPGINKAFGLMLPAGFVGGHGTAAAVGDVLAENGWADAISVGQTFATIGLLGGTAIGIILVNIGTKKGYTKLIKQVHHLPEEMRTGLVPESERRSIGEATINPMSIDPLTWHLALILVSVGAAYLANRGLKILMPSITFPVYGLALLCSIALQAILKAVKLAPYVDKRISTHIGSTATDYLVAFGVASTKISVVIEYGLPILLLVALGFAFVIAWHFIVPRRFFRSYWYERSLYIFGMSTGVMAIGVILLRIADPEFKSGVLEDFGLAWIFLSVIDLMIVSLSPLFVLSGLGLPYGLVLIALAVTNLLISKKMFGLQKH